MQTEMSVSEQATVHYVRADLSTIAKVPQLMITTEDGYI